MDQSGTKAEIITNFDGEHTHAISQNGDHVHSLDLNGSHAHNLNS